MEPQLATAGLALALDGIRQTDIAGNVSAAQVDLEAVDDRVHEPSLA
jgi:hypothetical protein